MSMDFDEILQHVGQFGPFQIYILALIAVPIMISAWQAFLHAFVGYIPSHRCEIEKCDSANSSYMESWLNNTVPGEGQGPDWVPDSCLMYTHIDNNTQDFCTTSHHSNFTESCIAWKFEKKDFDTTIATEWNLFCDKERLVALAGTVNMAGGLIGYLIMGYLSDRFGRKVGILCCLFFLVGFGIASAFSPNLYVFMAMRFLIEAMESSLYQLVFVLATEFIGPEKRVFGAQIIQLTYSCGEMTMAGLGYVFRSWRALQLVTTVPCFLFLSFYWFLPESARWLLANKRESEANAIINKIAKWNTGNVVQEMCSQYGTMHGSVNSVNEVSEVSSETEILAEHKETPVNVLYLFRTSRLRMRTIVIMMCWLLNVLVYNGVTLNATAIPGSSAQLNFFLTGLVEVPANLLSIYTMNTIGRRITLAASFILTGIPLIVIQFIPGDDKYVWVMIGMTLIGKFGSTIGNSVLYLFAAEILPTVLRNSGMGLCGLISTVASMIAPQITLFGQFQESLPYIIFGTGSLIGGGVSLLLPETLNQRLPETIEDAENFGK